jgi:hypothetical protein
MLPGLCGGGGLPETHQEDRKLTRRVDMKSRRLTNWFKLLILLVSIAFLAIYYQNSNLGRYIQMTGLPLGIFGTITGTTYLFDSEARVWRDIWPSRSAVNTSLKVSPWPREKRVQILPTSREAIPRQGSRLRLLHSQRSQPGAAKALAYYHRRPLKEILEEALSRYIKKAGTDESLAVYLKCLGKVYPWMSRIRQVSVVIPSG